MRYQKILQDKLQSQFGYIDYKNYLQKEATEAVYKNEKDIYICMPSGFGKSLCFQLPITIKDNSFAIVISPTIASATHQVNYLKSKQILVYNWDAYTSKKIKFKIKQEMKSRRPKIKLLYITPEQYISSSFQIILKNIQPNVLSYFVIDEVHCLSPWSHDYRHSYRKFVEWPLKRPNVPIIAVTASATKEVIEDIFKTLQMKDPLIFTMPVFRSNLFHDIWFIDNLPDPVQHLKQFIVESLGHVDMSVPKEKRNAGIIFCQKRDTTINLANVLNSMGISAVAYDTRFKIRTRLKIQHLWNSGAVSIIISTNNFGIGVSKQTVRFTVHWYALSSIANYYQESGRAGHDGNMSYCRIYCYFKDIRNFNQQNLFISENPNQQIYSQTKIILLMEMLKSIMKMECMHAVISKYFGNQVPICKYRCNVCKNTEAAKERLLQLNYFHQNNLTYNGSLESFNLNIYEKFDNYQEMLLDNQSSMSVNADNKSILLEIFQKFETSINDNKISKVTPTHNQKMDQFIYINENQENKDLDFIRTEPNLHGEIRANADLQIQEIYKTLYRKESINSSSPCTSLVSRTNSNLFNVYESINAENNTKNSIKKLKKRGTARENKIKYLKNNKCDRKFCSHMYCQMSAEEQLKVIHKMLYNKQL